MNFIRKYLVRLVSLEIENPEEKISYLRKHVERLWIENRILVPENERLEKDNSNLESEIKRLESRRSGLADANIRKELKIKQMEKQISELYIALDYHKMLNAQYAADRQQMISDKDPFYAARNFPRVTKFLNREEKGE